MKIRRLPVPDGAADATPGSKVLEYCLRPPQIWESDGHGGLALRCLGWAVAAGAGDVVGRVCIDGEVRKWVRPCYSRPDVQQHFQQQGQSVTEFSGLDFLIYMEAVVDTTLLSLELFAGGYATEPLTLDVGTLYRQHRASLPRERRFTGLYTEAVG
jgi:hypothetical protein